NQVKLCDTKDLSIVDELENFIAQFDAPKQEYDFITNGLFGYTSYDAIPLFEDIEFKAASNEIPLIHYQIFQNLIVFDHYYNTLYLIELTLQGQNSSISNILDLISNRSAFIFPFSIESETTSNFTDDEFLSLIQKGKEHCFKGDVFQVVF